MIPMRMEISPSPRVRAADLPSNPSLRAISTRLARSRRAFCAVTLAISLAGAALPSCASAQAPEAALQPIHPASPHAPRPHLVPSKKLAKVRATRHAPEARPATLTAAADRIEAAAEGHKPQATFAPSQAKLEAPSAHPAEAPAVPQEVVQFCSNNVAAAGQARVAWEAAKLKDLEAKLRQRIGELEAKRAEYEEWLHRRDEALKKAEDNIVAIYTRMRPDAAALQLSAMDDDVAAAVLSKLKPSNASAILNEMDPGRAARLTATMVGASPAPDGKKT
jgi:flagellar motility protein MotE (MotC chaperone)